MNVTCPNCATVYRIDPAKVPESGVRARCNICSAVFAVRREGEASDRPAAAAAVSAASASPPPPPAAVAPPAPPAAPGPSGGRAEPARPSAPRVPPAPPAVSAPVPPPAAPAGTAPQRPTYSSARRPRAARWGRRTGWIRAPGAVFAGLRAVLYSARSGRAGVRAPGRRRSTSGAARCRDTGSDTSSGEHGSARLRLEAGEPVSVTGSRAQGAPPGTRADLRHGRLPPWQAAGWAPGRQSEGIVRGRDPEELGGVRGAGREDVADSTPYFKEALNEILAGGRQIF